MRSTLIRASLFGLAVAMMAASAGVAGFASTVSVPEIDGGSISAGLAAASAAVLILRARRSK